MEPQVENQQQAPQSVSFPQAREPEGGRKGIKMIIALVGVLLIIGLGGWFILGNNSGEGAGRATPTPESGGLSSFPTPEVTSTPEPTSTATAAPVDKSEVKIEVLNGTGTPGDAGFLQKELEALGFEDITAGNADKQGQTETTVTYSRELSPGVSDEITEKLEALYENVRTRRASLSGDLDVSIVTGTRKKATSASPKVSPSASPKASATPTATPTP